MMENWMYIWLGVIVVTIVAEIITVGLTSIWLTGGALVALVLNLLGAHWGVQIAAFFVVTFILIYFTRPWAMKYLNNKKTASNYEETLGKEVRVVEKVENQMGTGKAIYNGMEWTARSTDDGVIFEPEEMARVVSVEGVKLMLEKLS